MGEVVHIFRAAAFEPELLEALGEAYDLAIASLPSLVRTGNLDFSIAKQLISLAERGERDAVRLSHEALKATQVEIREAEQRAHF